jgi:hypothetical protein
LRAKRKEAAEDRSLTALIEDGLRRVLNEPRSTVPEKRQLPPVSTATGGLMPGIDLNNTADLQEIEDLDYAKRLL